ncbi:E3 ubiquitin-protein ligase UBR5-like [Dendronephthya gigantea]|nr:E3 ubiquitin-protein ligase UBR5-like [Dendronephthya gigantea]
MHLQFCDPTDEKCVQARMWFEQYIDELDEKERASDQETLSDLVQFWTSSPALPSAASQKLTVAYQPDCTTKLLPEANTCPMVLSIPVVHSSYESFKKFIDKAVSFAKVGFGKM